MTRSACPRLMLRGSAVRPLCVRVLSLLVALLALCDGLLPPPPTAAAGGRRPYMDRRASLSSPSLRVEEVRQVAVLGEGALRPRQLSPEASMEARRQQRQRLIQAQVALYERYRAEHPPGEIKE